MKQGRGPSWLWVLVQFVLLAGLLFLPAGPLLPFLSFPRPVSYLLQGAGLLMIMVAALNLGSSLTPLPAPREEGGLVTGGLYRYVRHPIYTGALIWALGFTLASAGAYRLLFFALLCVFFWFKARYEEGLLVQKFPAYAQYAKHTPRFFPFL